MYSPHTPRSFSPCFLPCWTRPPGLLSILPFPAAARQVGRRVLDSSGALVRELVPERGWEERDGDHVALLTAETVRDGHSVLIFCASKVSQKRKSLGGVTR